MWGLEHYPGLSKKQKRESEDRKGHRESGKRALARPCVAMMVTHRSHLQSGRLRNHLWEWELYY